MKTKLGILTLVVATGWSALPVMAADLTDVNTLTATTNGDMSMDHPRLGRLEKSNKIIGMDVRDSQNQHLGRVRDLAVDLNNGRITEVIVGIGGDQYVAVPPNAFTCDANAKALMVNIDRSRLSSAPTFNLASWDANVDRTNISQVYQYYGVQPYFTATDRPANWQTTPQHAAEAQAPKANKEGCYLGQVHKTSKLEGATVRNANGERIGKVDYLVLDLPAGRVVEVAIGTGGFLGLDQDITAVPPQSFKEGSEKGDVVLDVTKDSLASAPRYKSSDWNGMNNAQNVGATYQKYNVQPYFSTNNADNTAQNVQDRSNGTLTPLNQGTSQADVETTREIRKEIVADGDLSTDAHNVKIITIDGHVTLRGPVKTDAEKQQIGDIAAKVATAANVNNQIQVVHTTSANNVQP